MVFFEQSLDVVHAADVCHLQQLTDLLSPGLFFRGTVLSGHVFYLLCDASFLHLMGGLHKVWDGLTAVDLLCRTHARITPPEPDVKGLRAAVRGAPMNGGLAAALDIHPRRRYTARKAAVG